ncbi:MAG: hypothetical protein ABI625_23155 [bacterium]
MLSSTCGLVIAPLAFVLLAVTPSSGTAQGAVPDGQPVGGISCDAMEGQRLHIHQHIAILDHGKAVPVPENVGQPTGKRCLYWIHTHTPDGIIHIEAPQNRSFTLGDFFAVWGQPLGTTLAATARAAKGEKTKVWLNGKPFAGDPRSILLVAHADIVIQVGPPFSKPAPFTAWNGQ